AHLRKPAYDVDEVARLELLPRRGHELNERLPRVAPLAHDEVAEVAAAVGLRVRLEALLPRPRAHGATDAVAEVGGEPAPLDVEDFVPAAGAVESERRPVGCARERVLELVAVVEDPGLAGDDGGERRLGDAADALQRVAHLLVLLLQLLLVREILEAAAPAGGEVRTGRVDVVRAGVHDPGREGLGVAALDLGDPRADTVARQPAADEDDIAVDPRDAVTAVGERLDVELELLVLRHRRGHRASLATAGRNTDGADTAGARPRYGSDTASSRTADANTASRDTHVTGPDPCLRRRATARGRTPRAEPMPTKTWGEAGG